jgi:hypothetical protein
MRTARFLRIAIPAAGALLLAAGAVVVTASATGLNLHSLVAATTPSPSPSTPARDGGRGAACQDFLGHLATELGISSDKLDTAAVAAGKETVQDRVASGAITQAEADKIEARLTSDGICSVLGGGDVRSGAIKAYLSAAADALGVSDSQLVADLKGGQTLSQVAAAQGVSEDQFKTKVIASLKPKLDAGVAAHQITQAQEDKILAKLQNGDPPLWNKTPKKGG